MKLNKKKVRTEIKSWVGLKLLIRSVRLPQISSRRCSRVNISMTRILASVSDVLHPHSIHYYYWTGVRIIAVEKPLNLCFATIILPHSPMFLCFPLVSLPLRSFVPLLICLPFLPPPLPPPHLRGLPLNQKITIPKTFAILIPFIQWIFRNDTSFVPSDFIPFSLYVLHPFPLYSVTPPLVTPLTPPQFSPR